MSCVRPKETHTKRDLVQPTIKGRKENIRGILLALRYLSLEAEGAGLSELAEALEAEALKCNLYITENS